MVSLPGVIVVIRSPSLCRPERFEKGRGNRLELAPKALPLIMFHPLVDRLVICCVFFFSRCRRRKHLDAAVFPLWHESDARHSLPCVLGIYPSFR